MKKKISIIINSCALNKPEMDYFRSNILSQINMVNRWLHKLLSTCRQMKLAAILRHLQVNFSLFVYCGFCFYFVLLEC